MHGQADFAAVFERLERTGQREETVALGGVNVRMVRLPEGSEGRWDSHGATAETVLVWRGDFTVEMGEETLVLSAGQCCVVPLGVEHRGSSRTGADVVLFQVAG